MTNRDEVLEVVRGGGSRVPASFWLHFDESLRGEAAAREHIRFVRDTGADVVKLMNEHPYPPSHDLSSAAGWAAVPRMRSSDAWFREQVDMVKRAVDLVAGDAVVLYTVFGPIAAAYHTGRGGDEVNRGDGALGRPDPELDRLRIGAHLHEEPALVSGVLDMIADVSAELAAAVIDAGADGIFYSAWGGERTMMTDEQFAEHVRERDLRVLSAVADAPAFNVLHICKPDTELSRFAGYDPRVVNWAGHSNGVSIEQGRAFFPDATLLGGIDTVDRVLNGGTPEEVAELVRGVLDGVSDHRRFILGPDCALPMSTPEENLRAAVEVAHSYTR